MTDDTPFLRKILDHSHDSGPPHSAAERWQAYCDRWLKDSNVRIVSRLEARPIGPAMPNGVITRGTTRGTNDER